AELFGNQANYPNSGSPERPGLLGQANGSTLFLDEIADLPQDLQSHLLRVLDSGGQYHRLGEARARRADVRVLGATGRSPDLLRQDFAARFKLRIDVPNLASRREDIPLIVRHLLSTSLLNAASEEDGGPPKPRRPSCGLMKELVLRTYRTNVRE